MDRLKELRDSMIRDLNKIYSENESIALVQILFYSVAGIEKKDFSLDPDKIIDENIKADLREKMAELMAHKPAQYVTGTAYFFDLELEVNPSVLIPRPETEELVKWIADDHKNIHGLKVLDIGTGSGCIIIALGRLLNDPQFTAIDISGDALLTAKRNAGKYKIQCDFRLADILDESVWDKLGNFDLIVSNPPYVREMEKSLMKANVLDYEPHEALFVPDEDPLIFYRAIAKFARSKLSEKGRLFFEINENLGQETFRLLENEGFSEITMKKDLHSKDRMIRCLLC